MKKILILIAVTALLSGCAKNSILDLDPPEAGVDQAAQESTYGAMGGGSMNSFDVYDDPAVDEGRNGLNNKAISGLQRVHFALDQYTIDGQSKETLNANADHIKNVKDGNIVIEGHCDSRGTGMYNIALGQKRAQAVKDYLITNGVREDRLSAVSFGEEVPLSLGETEEDHALNRRVEFKLK